MFDLLRGAIRQKLVFTCKSCGDVVKARELRMLTKGLAHVGNKEAQELSNKMSHGQATREEWCRYLELIGMKTFLVCKRCGKSEMEITREC